MTVSHTFAISARCFLLIIMFTTHKLYSARICEFTGRSRYKHSRISTVSSLSSFHPRVVPLGDEVLFIPFGQGRPLDNGLQTGEAEQPYRLRARPNLPYAQVTLTCGGQIYQSYRVFILKLYTGIISPIHKTPKAPYKMLYTRARYHYDAFLSPST